MSEPPAEPSDEDEFEAGPPSGSDSAETLSETAASASVTPDRLRAPLVTEGESTASTRLLDVLAPGEKPQYLLDGIMADNVRGDGKLRRRMARPGGNVFTLVTDRAVHLVVQYRDRIDVETVPLTSVGSTTVQHAGGETRLDIETADEQFRVYPSASPAAETDAAAAYLDEWEESDGATTAEGNTDADDLVSALERLATLYERGLLTDEEFVTAKRDLLQ